MHGTYNIDSPLMEQRVLDKNKNWEQKMLLKKK